MPSPRVRAAQCLFLEGLSLGPGAEPLSPSVKLQVRKGAVGGHTDSLERALGHILWTLGEFWETLREDVLEKGK